MAELKFHNDREKQPKLNQRVLLYLGNQIEFYLSGLKFCTAIYQYNENKGKNTFVIDGGGQISYDVELFWSEFPAFNEQALQGNLF